jgi:gluconolactonase
MRAFLFAVGSLLVVGCGTSDDGSGGNGGSGGAKATGGASGGGAGGGSSGGGSGGSSGGSGGTGGSAGSVTGGSSGSGGTAGGSGGTGGGTTAWACPAGPYDTNPIPDGATPSAVAGVPPADNYQEGMDHNVEGPLWFEGALYVSHITNIGKPPKSRILKILDGVVTVAINDSGTNGLAVGPDGKAYGACHEDGSIALLDFGAMTVTPHIAMYEGARFNSPNDLAFRSDGNLYFSDPNYQAPGPEDPQSAQRVYRVAPGSTTPTVVDELSHPNGVTLSIDENTLYVKHDSGLTKYALDSMGVPDAGTPVNGFSGPGDGMAMDCAGNLYIAGEGVTVLDPTGSEIDSISLPIDNWVTNVAFGGPDRKTLFITYMDATAGVYQVDVNIPGKPY